MAIDFGRLLNKKTHHIAHNVRKRCIKRGLKKGFTIASKKILLFVNLNSKLIELKKSVFLWTRTRRKISLVE